MRYGSLLGIALLGLVPLALIAGRAQTRGGVYAAPIGEARRVLAHTGLPPLVFGSNEPEFTVRAEGAVQADGAGRIVWILHEDGAEMMRYVASLSPDGGTSTRIDLDLVGATQGRFRDTGARLAQNGAIRHLYLVAMEERIASALEHRPFNTAAILPATAAATAANIGRIGSDIDRIAEADHRRERANIEKAYREEAAGGSH
jgi:hypothetical protein